MHTGMAAARYVRAKELLEAELGDELVALDVGGGDCFGFNSVAADIWRLLEQPREFRELHLALAGKYDVDIEQCAAELRSCLADLEAQGLVRTVAGDDTSG